MFTLDQAMKSHTGSRGIAVLFDRGARRGGVGGQFHAPAALPPIMTRYTFYSRLGVPHGRSGRVRNISPCRDLIPGSSRR